MPTPSTESTTTESATNEPRVLLAAAATVVLWASSFIVIRYAGPAYGAGSMALLRMLVGSAVLGLIALRSGIRWPPRRSVPLVIVWGVAWFCLYILALNVAEQTIDAGTAAMVVNLAPLMVVVFAGLFLGEGFPRGLVIGAPVSFLGVVLIGLSSHSHGRPGSGSGAVGSTDSVGSTGGVAITGLLLALAAAVLYAGATLLQKRLLRTVDSATLTWLGATAGAVALLPWAGELARDLGTAPQGATLSLVYLGVLPTAFAFTTWAYVLKRSSAGRTSATTYVVPAVAIVLSWLLLGETPTLAMLIGGALCLLGVAITRMVR
ncbi:DMT family transporter [Arsenicicoccus piscis]|uniref:Membrane protein n=1 Tax=Arsenicicoccus piscis TaxID=673954 RepID=A0ABQ6HM47_9MICO|nr:EamA family transporter [Arsenicicoccus piscis]MCH8627008.1 DMT family transporter [Arsenicicoccus piscis]GMA19067.1 membrane protein [Arsenicicoccus piscis]